MVLDLEITHDYCFETGWSHTYFLQVLNGEKKNTMKRILLVLAVLVGCAENKKLDEQLPEIKVTESKVITEGGGLLPITYRLSFKGNIINLSDDVFKSFRQTVVFNAANGNQVDAPIGLPMFRWLCPRDTLNFFGKSKTFAEGYIDSVVSYEAVEIGQIIVYGQGNECDKN